MRSLPELVEFIRVSCKNKNSSITKMEKDLNFANGTVGKWANGKRYPPFCRTCANSRPAVLRRPENCSGTR